MRNFGVVVLLSGMALVGCAREDRWTLDGTPPSALQDDHRSAPGVASPAKSKTPLALSSVSLVDRKGACYVKNPDPKQNILVTLLVTPSTTGKGHVSPKRQQVLVPAGGETQAGLTSDATGTTWKYTLLEAAYL